MLGCTVTVYGYLLYTLSYQFWCDISLFRIIRGVFFWKFTKNVRDLVRPSDDLLLDLGDFEASEARFVMFLIGKAVLNFSLASSLLGI